jgi:hypothetical protein
MNQQMYQQNNQQMYMNPQQVQMQQIATQNQQMQQQIPVTVRFVTKYNEADAAQIAFDNTINLFINLASGEIYMKRFDMNSGQAPLVTYRQERQKAAQDEPEHAVQYATVEMVMAIESRLNELADAINAEVIELCSRGFEAAGRAIEEMYNEPDMLLYAVISEFVDRTKNSGYRADICNADGDVISDRIEMVGETWENMYVNNPKVFRKSMADAREQADMLNSKLKLLVDEKIPEREFIFN